MLPEKDRPVDVEPIPEESHPTKTTKVINKFVVLALVLIAIGLGVILKWSFANANVLEIKNSPFPARVIADDSGETGGIVFLHAEYCKNSDIEGELRLSYVSKNREVFLPVQPERLAEGCASRDVPVVIPKDLPRDTYKINFRATYDINPLKQGVVVDFESQEFTVGPQ
jgi:hypothetical protein